MEHFLFLHAHPDDEAIFTGGTIARLAAVGVNSTVLVATSGDLTTADPTVGDAAATRRRETIAACAHLGTDDVRFLGYADSGLGTWMPSSPHAFAYANVERAAHEVAAIAHAVGATALVYYDDGGIYGHIDHLKVHAVGRRAVEIADIASSYQATVDSEYLHFVDTHLVGVAALATHDDLPTGLPTVLISTTVDASSVLDVKRQAMASHASQIPPGSQPFQLDDDTFAAVYGYEWYVRDGALSAIDRLAE